MKRAAFAGLILLFLFAAGEPSQLVVLIEDPHGSTFEIASRAVSCADTTVRIDAEYGTRDDCIDRCAYRSADGRYTMHAGVIPALECLGPRGAVRIPGTGTLESRPVLFCADDTCTRVLDYCDCTPPNLSVPTSDRWYSEPFTIEVEAHDNYNLSRIESSALQTCTGPACAQNITVPIGTVCIQTGSATCAVYVNATDLWDHTAHAVLRYNVDLNAPIARHEWIGAGAYHKDRVHVRFEAHEPTADESGVAAIWIEKRTEAGCSEPGSNYTRYENPVERSFEDPGSGVAFCYFASDRAVPANRGAVQRTQTRYADTTPPRLSIEPTGWRSTNERVTITCTDEQSGCDAYGIILTNGTCPPAGAPPYDPSPVRTDCESGSVCTYGICAWGRDAVGHEVFVEEELSIDLSEPTIEVSNIHYRADRTVLDLIISDSGSGLSSCTITSPTHEPIDCDVDGPITSLSAALVCDEPCTYTIRVEDHAGNEATLEHTRIPEGSTDESI